VCLCLILQSIVRCQQAILSPAAKLYLPVWTALQDSKFGAAGRLKPDRASQ